VPAAAVPVIWQFVNVATPATADIVEHDNDPEAGPVLFARVTLPLSEVTTLPEESSTFTVGEILTFVPSTTSPTDWVVNTSLDLAVTPESRRLQ